MKKGLTSGLVLLVLGLIAGLLLGVVNTVTAPIIAANELREKLTALEVFYPDIQTAYDVAEVTVGENGIESIFVLKTKGTETIVAAVYSVKKMGYKTAAAMLIAVNADGTVQWILLHRHRRHGRPRPRAERHRFRHDRRTGRR
ncbi:MAG: hypothetical protein M0C28_18610 [Candidatus Moduliflexus flocculans]|nr:hypothetical protein [Candidatus Moduliflexus flocculans]